MTFHYEIVGLYRYGFIVAVRPTPKRLQRRIKKAVGAAVDIDQLWVGAGKSLTLQCENGGFIEIVLLKETSANTIAHECVHAAENMLDHAGVKHSPDNHEALAYLVGYLAEICDNVVKTHNKNKKKGKKKGKKK